MTGKTSHHPTEELLKSFNEGLLSIGFSVAVSAHLEFCDDCRRLADGQRSELASAWLQAESEDNTPDFSSIEQLLDNITSQPQEFEEQFFEPLELRIEERSAVLPRVLTRAVQQRVSWRNIGGGVKTASLKLDREGNCDFMYMKPGVKGVTHTHHGTEVMVVLDGSFVDELGEYRRGDFVMRNPEHTHTPGSSEGCLCYSYLDSPLHFTSGLARLLNPMQRYLFNRQLRQNV